MTIPSNLPNIPSPPAEYSKEYMEKVIQALVNHLRSVNSIGQITTGGMMITQLPTSDVDLKVGVLWNDGGTVKIKT